MRLKCHRSLIFGLGLVPSLSAFATLANAQQGPAVSVKPVSDGVYWADAGGGGNAGFIIGKDGVIVVDATIAPSSGKQVLDAIAKLTPKPVTTVILTHSDVDHVNGLAAFPPGLTMIAHEDCKKDMEATANSRNPSPQDRLPNKTLTKSESLTINGVKLNVLHFAPAHTSGDLQVYLPDQKIVFTGDVIATSCCGNVRSPQAYTMIKVQKNGSAEGWVQTVKGLLALNAETYVPGHGDLQTKADLQERLARVEARRNQIKKMVAEGKSLEQVKQALGETGPAPCYDLAQFPDFTAVVYNEFAKKR
jgi:cyclase